MPKVQEKDSEIIFLEKVPNGLRVFLSIIGLFAMIFAPYELLVRPNWSGFSLYLIIPIIVSVGAFLLGSLFIVAGLFGLNQTLRISAKSESIIYSYDSALMPFRRKTYNFKDVTNIEVKIHDWTDGPSTYGLKFLFANGQKIEIGSFERRNEAEQYLSKVENLIR